MKSYGELLRETREGKNLDISTVSRDTTIDTTLIKAMEEETESVFPGESYLTGFLRNYAEYLGLDPSEVLALYHNKTLQESPVPTALLARESRRGVVIAVILSVVFAAAVAGGIVYYKMKKADSTGEEIEDTSDKPRQFILGDSPLKERLYKGDQILVPIALSAASSGQNSSTELNRRSQTADESGKASDEEEESEKSYVILTVSSTVVSLGIDTPVGTIRTELSDESEIDIDGDGKGDIIVYVSEISMTDEARGCETRVLLSRNGGVVKNTTADTVDVASVVPGGEAKEAADTGGHKPYVILEDNRAYSFTIDAVFRGPCEFRHRIDRKVTEESYYSNGDTVTMTAFNGIRLWMSNANAVKLSIVADAHGYDLEIGRAGQVLVEDIKWIKVNGRYRLVAIELD